MNKYKLRTRSARAQMPLTMDNDRTIGAIMTLFKDLESHLGDIDNRLAAIEKGEG